MNLDPEKLRSLLDLLIEKDIAEFEHEDEAARIKIVRGARVAVAPAGLPVAVPAGAPSKAALEAAAPADTVDVTSPFVGTFYRAPSPDAPTFVEVGSVIRPGQTLCIIEAMKLMNEIESEVDGTVVEVLVENNHAVQYGDALFKLRKG